MRHRLLLLCATTAALFSASEARAHCEIPCGIYHDDQRFPTLDEHVQTIEKSMLKIVELSADPAANANQITRWVLNKEKHADNIQETVTQYFLTQRIKLPDMPDMSDSKAVKTYKDQLETYKDQLAMLHKLLVYAMKSKQTTDVANTKVLHDTIHEFKAAYMGK
jgi:nickel superoxide dismutase